MAAIVIVPRITQVERHAVLGKIRAVQLSQGQVVTVQAQLHQLPSGEPIDLGQFGFGGSSIGGDSEHKLVAKIVEPLSNWPGSKGAAEVECSSPDPGNGLVNILVPKKVTEYAGIRICEIGLLTKDTNDLLHANSVMFFINPGLFGKTTNRRGPPSVQELKLSMRDSAPEDGYLLDEEEFDLAELCNAVVWPVRAWNEWQPAVGVNYSTISYPYAEQWRLGAMSHLYQIAAAHYRREDLAYSADGITVADKNKAGQYEEMSARLLAEYKRWVTLEKVRINAEACFGSSGALMDVYTRPWR